MFSLLSIHFFVRTGGENSLFQRYYFVCRYVFLGESSTQVHYPFFKLNYLFFAIELQKLFIYLRYQPRQPVASFIHKEEWKEASDSETCFQMLETSQMFLKRSINCIRRRLPSKSYYFVHFFDSKLQHLNFHGFRYLVYLAYIVDPWTTKGLSEYNLQLVLCVNGSFACEDSASHGPCSSVVFPSEKRSPISRPGTIQTTVL